MFLIFNCLTCLCCQIDLLFGCILFIDFFLFFLWISSCSSTILERVFPFLFEFLSVSSSKTTWPYTWSIFLNTVLFHWSFCLSFHHKHTVLFYVVLYKFLKSKFGLLTLVFFKRVLTILGPLLFQIHFKSSLSISQGKKTHWILLGICWIYRSILGKLVSFQYSVFWSIKMI